MKTIPTIPRDDRAPRRPAFTLTEMLVAVGITSILIVGLNQLFGMVTEAVDRGLAASEIVQNARIVADTIKLDGDNMVPPEEGGVLIIVSERINGVEYSDDFTQTTSVQSDQLAFTRRRGRLQPVVPASDSGFPSAPSRAAYTRVWYGHALELAPDGSTDGTSLGNGINAHPVDWILGRQVIFFDPEATGTQYSGLNDLGSDGYRAEKDVVGTAYTGTGDAVLTQLNQATNYEDEALKLAYTSDRLRVLPRPEVLSGEDLNVGQTFDNDNIARMHPMLASNVNQFQVHFAGNFQGGSNSGLDEDSDGNIEWYSAEDPPTGVTTVSTSQGQAVVFRHGFGQRWPDLIRIRYRVNDADAVISDTDSLPGRWFEQIIRVPEGG